MLGVEILTWEEGSTWPWYTAPGWRTAVALLTPEFPHLALQQQVLVEPW